MDVLRCRCGVGGISVGDTRITKHKCDGHWIVETSYRVESDDVVRAFEDAAEDAAFAARRDGAKEGK